MRLNDKLQGKTPEAPCHFCSKEVDREEHLCRGCGHVVCEDCDIMMPWGSHSVIDHTEDLLNEEDEQW